MATIKMEEYEEFPVLPADSIILTKVTDLELKEVPGRNGSWEKLEFTFTITGIQVTGDGSPVENYEALIGSKIWGSVPFRFVNSPDNRLKQYVEAILGMEVGVGFELDTDLLTGRKVRAITDTYDKKTINPRTQKPYKQHQVSTLLPFGGETVAAAPAPVAAVAAKTVWDEEPPF